MIPCLEPVITMAASGSGSAAEVEVEVEVEMGFSLIRGRSVVIPLITPNTFTSNVLWKFSVPGPSKGVGRPMPAFRARRLIWPGGFGNGVV